MGSAFDGGLIAFILLACCWYLLVMYYALRSWKSVLCYTLLPVAGICAALLIFSPAGLQHTYPPLFLAIPLLGAAAGIYIGYRIDTKTS